LLPDCDRESHCRGICKNDWIAASRLVKKGETTWEELESLGVARPLFRFRGRFTRALQTACEAARESAQPGIGGKLFFKKSEISPGHLRSLSTRC
jgi:hypothetical protein